MQKRERSFDILFGVQDNETLKLGGPDREAQYSKEAPLYCMSKHAVKHSQIKPSLLIFGLKNIYC